MAFKTKSYLDSLIAKFYGKQSSFIAAVLNNNVSSAKSLAFELYKDHPAYLLFFYCINKDENRQVILNLLGRCKQIDPHLLYSLLNSSAYTYGDLRELLTNFKGHSFIDCCIKKAAFLKKHESYSGAESEGISSDASSICYELNELLCVVDDFQLYEFAIRNDIEIKKRNSPNYLWYSLIRGHKLKSVSEEVARDLILKTTSFQEIKRILDYCKIEDAGDKRYNIVIKYLNAGFSTDLLRQAFVLLDGDQSFITVKIVLALLIASKDEGLIVLALYLSQTCHFEANYEIGLIDLYLCRYFLLFRQLMMKIEKLDIKNVQQHNLAYLWSDPMNVAKVRLNDYIKAFQNEIKNEIDGSEVMIRKFIDNNLVSSAVSCLELRSSLLNSVICDEIRQLKIKSTNPQTMFSELLGEECRYMFDKVTASDCRIPGGTIDTLRSVADQPFSSKIYENEFMKITDQNFIMNFERAIFSKSKK